MIALFIAAILAGLIGGALLYYLAESGDIEMTWPDGAKLIAIAALFVAALFLTSCASTYDLKPCPHPGIESEYAPVRHLLHFPDLSNQTR